MFWKKIKVSQKDLLKSGGWFDYDSIQGKLDFLSSELVLEENWSDKVKLLALQKEQKHKQDLLQNLINIQ